MVTLSINDLQSYFFKLKVLITGEIKKFLTLQFYNFETLLPKKL